jgi:hypothetical protein
MPCPLCGRSSRTDVVAVCTHEKLKIELCDTHTRDSQRNPQTKCPSCKRGNTLAFKNVSTGVNRRAVDRDFPRTYALQYLGQIPQTRAALKQNLHTPGPTPQDTARTLDLVLQHDFVITHETTWPGLAYQLGRGGVDCQARIIKHAPNLVATHRDSVNGGGHFVYTRVVSTRGPGVNLKTGSQGAASPIMLVFSRELIRDRFRDMFGASTDRYGSIGSPAQQDLTLTGVERGTLALSVVLAELTKGAGPAQENEFGFFSRIDFKHLRAIVVKLDQGAGVNAGTQNLPAAERASMTAAAGTVLADQPGRIAPKRQRNGTDAYGTADSPVAPDLVASVAFQAAFGRTLNDIVLGLPKSTLRSALPTVLTQKHL